jgi:hypothetical protein
MAGFENTAARCKWFERNDLNHLAEDAKTVTRFIGTFGFCHLLG